MKTPLIFAILSMIVLTKCEKYERCIEYYQAPITLTNTPSTGGTNEEIPITVSFECFNGCGQFGSFAVNKKGNTFYIKVIAKYEGCGCTLDIPTRQTIYSFKTSQQGTYCLKFMQDGDNYLTDTLVIQ